MVAGSDIFNLLDNKLASKYLGYSTVSCKGDPVSVGF